MNNKLFKKIAAHFYFLFFAVCLVSQTSVQAQEIDMLIKGGHVIDPKNKIDGIMDVAVKDGKIFRVASNIPANTSKKTVDATGLYVSPGFIDMHVHVFAGAEDPGYAGFGISNGFGSVAPDDFTFRSGVTTVVDAGSSGWRNFPAFKKQTIDNSQTRVLAFISITGHGMLGTVHAQDTTDMNPVTTAFIMKEYPDIIVGIKAHHYQGHDFTPVDRAIAAGRITKKPIIVDFGSSTPKLSIEELFMKHFRPGDIFTHTFSGSATSELAPGGRQSVVDANNKVKPFIFEAQKQGRIFDVGHGGGAFVWSTAINSIKQGFLPNTISTDLYRNSRNAGMKDMANVMSKFLNMGMSIQDVVLRSTWNPANVIQHTDLGHLSVGAEADVAVFNVREGKFGFMDARGSVLNGTKKLEAELTLRAGKVAWDLNGISGPQWDAVSK
ncbi:dihydroorotase [Daejeonella rubra]|uniref:Dihydroorotase n=1 Tax=Daejeonella rubra TaxID=990371 RepID=A0A1G9SVB2_9SPHI|nr:amidohydrolase/deacetylase family metallohydrolase [Daejeonella rubra]SDM39409.1 dihydroorotase [Daejeonella rubra]